MKEMLLFREVNPPSHMKRKFTDLVNFGTNVMINGHHTHTSDIIAPSLVGGSEHIAEGLWSFPIYPHTLTMMRSNSDDWNWGMFHVTNHVTKH